MSYCNWDKASLECQCYHDTEWGVPLHDDQKQFEFLMMEVMQCGLSWDLMIRKRDIFRKCFNNFDFDKIARYDRADIDRILNTPGMIKSIRKIQAIIHNAKCFQKVRSEFGSFDAYLWANSDGQTILYEKHNQGFIPASNALSEAISKDLKKRGFQFLGPVVVYSHLQACGIINDHDENCPRYDYIVKNFPIIRKKRLGEKDVHYFAKEQK